MKSLSEYTLLIVDDEADLREAISFDFRRKGFKVLTAADGQEGFEIVKNNKVDLVLSDVRMPGGGGVGLLDRVKEKDAFLPVMMFITGFSDMPLEEAYDRGADAVFSKPFDRKELFSAVIRALKPANERFFRQDFRLELELPVGIKFLKDGISIDARVLNIGRGGMFVALSNQFPTELESVEFRMDIPLNPIFSVTGQGIVRWIRRQESAEGHPLGCGIEFSCLESESMKKFLEIIKGVRTKSFIPKR